MCYDKEQYGKICFVNEKREVTTFTGMQQSGTGMSV